MLNVDLSKPAAEGMVRVTFLPEGRTVEFPFDSLPYEGHGRADVVSRCGGEL